tara:strand:- start:107 stop:283 length:177 start_codon:yes stop_codon:yes gene_type:complete
LPGHDDQPVFIFLAVIMTNRDIASNSSTQNIIKEKTKSSTVGHCPHESEKKKEKKKQD